ncbi:MAG: hypothetical protein OJF60_001901 [Burkholderiaceae bacterium]|nr:MAG: hypothetical protein OJF60_001901 [Burkholderiaceae bacterium]
MSGADALAGRRFKSLLHLGLLRRGDALRRLETPKIIRK